MSNLVSVIAYLAGHCPSRLTRKLADSGANKGSSRKTGKVSCRSGKLLLVRIGCPVRLHVAESVPEMLGAISYYRPYQWNSTGQGMTESRRELVYQGIMLRALSVDCIVRFTELIEMRVCDPRSRIDWMSNGLRQGRERV